MINDWAGTNLLSEQIVMIEPCNHSAAFQNYKLRTIIRYKNVYLNGDISPSYYLVDSFRVIDLCMLRIIRMWVVYISIVYYMSCGCLFFSESTHINFLSNLILIAVHENTLERLKTMTPT